MKFKKKNLNLGFWEKKFRMLFYFFLSHAAKPMTSAMKVQSPNHWTTREFPRMLPLTLNQL